MHRYLFSVAGEENFVLDIVLPVLVAIFNFLLVCFQQYWSIWLRLNESFLPLVFFFPVYGLSAIEVCPFELYSCRAHRVLCL